MIEPEDMGKPLAYLDQNILDLFVKRFDQNHEVYAYFNENFQVIYSDTTLGEIYKGFLNSNNQEYVERYLRILERLDANHIRIACNRNLELLDKCVISTASIRDWFDRYVENKSEWGFLDKNIFNQTLLSFQEEKKFEEIKLDSMTAFQKNLEVIEKAIQNLKDFPELQRISQIIYIQIANYKESYEQVVDFMLSKIKKYAETEKLSEIFRKEIGIYPKHLNNIQMPRAIEKIWMLYKDQRNYEGQSIDDFLTINFWENQKGRKFFDYEKVSLIYNFLNFIGFYQDTKLDQINGAQRSMSDFTHAQMASFCHFFFTNDKNLIKKVNPIYEYLDKTTQIARIRVLS